MIFTRYNVRTELSLSSLNHEGNERVAGEKLPRRFPNLRTAWKKLWAEAE